jgi:hypothetical protein
MKHLFPSLLRRVGLVLLALTCASLACSLPTEKQPAPTKLPAIIPTITSEPKSAPSEEAATTAAEPTAVPEVKASVVKGLVVLTNEKFLAYGPDGKQLDFLIDAQGAKWLGTNQAQVVGETVYFSTLPDGAIVEASKTSVRKLDFASVKGVNQFAVSLDGKQIAWAVQSWDTAGPGSQIWIANLDGSGSRKIASVEPGQNPNFLEIHPLRWTTDGKLIYVEGLTGIGGYILFMGYNAAYTYDPSTGRTETLVPSGEKKTLCLSEISGDFTRAVYSCTPEGAATIVIHNLNDGTIKTIPSLPEQNQAGSVRFSPSGAWMAYGLARSNSENEQGWVAVTKSDGTGTPQVVTSLPGGVFTVETWLNENYILLESQVGDQVSVWGVNRDGSGLAKLADGQYIGLLMVTE